MVFAKPNWIEPRVALSLLADVEKGFHEVGFELRHPGIRIVQQNGLRQNAGRFPEDINAATPPKPDIEWVHINRLLCTDP